MVNLDPTGPDASTVPSSVLDVRDSPGRFLLVQSDGVVIAASPQAQAVLTESSIVASIPASLPTDLWSALIEAVDGTPLGWTTPRGTVSFVRHFFDAHRSLVLVDPPTQHRTASAQIYQSAQALFARIISSAAHDIRSPLSSMMFNVAVLRRRHADLSPEEVQGLLDEIADSCELQKRSVDAIVRTASSTEVVEVPLRQLLGRVGEILRPLFRGEDNALRVELDSEFVVRGMPMALEHIFINLFSNAVHASDESVVIKVTASRTSFREEPMVSVRVADNGPGIDPKVQSQIFDQFYTTRVNGMGMGLALAREAARQMGGDLALTAARAPGACFEVLLPEGRLEGSDEASP